MGVGRTFQIAETFASLTVVENVQMALLSHDRQAVLDVAARAADHKRDEALALLDQVGMKAQADRPCSVLAYGDVKRVELAIAMANAPKLLLMDEPTAGMAPQGAQRADGADQAARASSAASRCCSPSTAWTWCSPTPTA